MTTVEEAKRLLLVADVFYSDDAEEGAFTLNMNDVWGWACAWGETVPEDKLLEVAELFRRYGDAGLLYWVSERNDGLRSEFHDINRFVDFVRNEEQIRREVPDSNKRAYHKVRYTLGETP